MFDRRTRGWVLCTLSPKKIRPRNHGFVLAHDHEQPRTVGKKKSGALRQGMQTLSFPTDK